MQKGKNNYLTKRAKSELSELAESISEYYFEDHSISPEVICRKNNISYSFGHYKKSSFDGLIECYKNDFHIYLNLDRLEHAHTERARFTFAHELGHYFIDDHRNALRMGKSPSHSSVTGFVSKNYAEREADYFASALLLPQKRIEKHCFKRKFSATLIKELANKYQVSLPAASIRFADIGNHPIMVIYSCNGKILWNWNSNDFPYWKLKFGKSKVPSNTATGEYFENGILPRDEEIVYAIDWFEDVYERDYEREFKEYCFIKGKWVLTILWES